MTGLTRVVQPLVAGVLAVACSSPDRSQEIGAAGTDSAALAPSGADAAGLTVAAVMIGKRVGPGNLITEPTFQFTPADTVHISVATEGRGTGTLTAAWRSQSGEVLQQSSAPAGEGSEHAAFSLSQPKGLKPGTYKVIVFLDNDSADTKVFVVGK